MSQFTVVQIFNQPIAQVFASLAQHATYNTMFWPIQVVRVKDAPDAEHPDGVGSVRRMGFGAIKPLQEEITQLVPLQLIEYRLINNPLVKHHLGRLQFEALSPVQTQVRYTIEFEGVLPLTSQIVSAQLKLVVRLGLAKLAKSAA